MRSMALSWAARATVAYVDRLRAPWHAAVRAPMPLLLLVVLLL